ncbi:MAG: S9 family peptidase [Ignavibacteriales bacterium]|nr:S9 family peptidase [Ignavibacteriales bacterium]
MRTPCTLLAILVSASLSSSQPKDLETTVTMMAKIGACTSPTFSPDGKTVAFVWNVTGIPQIWTVPTTGGWPNLVTSLDDPVGAVRWSPDGNWLSFSLAPGGGMNQQVYIIRPDGTDMHRVTDGGKDNNWLGDWAHDGRFLTLASNRRTSSSMDAYLALVPGGSLRLVVQNQGTGQFVDVSKDNNFAILTRTVNRGNNNLYLVDLSNGNEKLLTPHEGPGSFAGSFGKDADVVYVATNKDRDLRAFGKINIKGGTPQEIQIVAERPDAELDGIEINDQGTSAVLLWNVAGRGELSFFDLTKEKIRPGPKLPLEIVGGVRFSNDGKLLVMVLSGSTSPADVWVFDIKSSKIWQVTKSPHPGIDLSKLIQPELVRFLAHDSLSLSGWLYVPASFVKPGPVVLSFHGGPEGQERPGFRSDYQALLSQGIAVFAPNVRGSAGFGKNFVNLDNGPLRANGIKDIKSCVEYVVQSGVADTKRIGIMGGSYGGYMVMAGLTEYPDLFAAGANLFGVVNFETFFANTEAWMAAISTVEYGDPKTQVEMLKSLSPINKVDKVMAPTIVLHGANDTNVPVVEAVQVVTNLKKRNIPVEYVLFPDEGHGWRKTPNRIKSTVSVTKWFAKYLRPASNGSK